MDLLKTPSLQSLIDSDLESIASLQYLDIEELDEVEYALPASEAPSLAEVLQEDEADEDSGTDNHHQHNTNSVKSTNSAEEASGCSTLQIEFLQAVSQQLTQAQERSSAGAATALSAGPGGLLSVGTAHGHILSFVEQALRWAECGGDAGAVACLAHNADGSRLLAGYADGPVVQYDSRQGAALRRLQLGADIWGVLRVAWADAAGLALDTGGSVWLLKFSRVLGVRGAAASCLFSGARGEVVAMAARCSRVLALATLTRVVLVAGGRATGARLAGPAHTMPTLAWCAADPRLLVCARATQLQWLAAEVSGAGAALRVVRRVRLDAPALWVGWVGAALALLDSDETLRLLGDDGERPLDLSFVEPVYASALFKGAWTEGRVSGALRAAGAGALGGAAVAGGALLLLGRRGVVRVRARAPAARAAALAAAGRWAPALALLLRAGDAALARRLLRDLAARPPLLEERDLAELVVKVCVAFELNDVLWADVWERGGAALAVAVADAVVAASLPPPPSPDCTQSLVERLADAEPALLERVLGAVPLSALDPHAAATFARRRRLWRAVGAVAQALGGTSNALRELTPHVDGACAARATGRCRCAGEALLLLAADALAARVHGQALLPDQRPSRRHDALQTLLMDTEPATGVPRESDPAAPIAALVRHDARAARRLLEQGWREPPFAGPLARQNRRRAARALLRHAAAAADEDKIEVAEFISQEISSGTLPERELCAAAAALAAAAGPAERADRVLRALAERCECPAPAAARPRLAWPRAAAAARPDDALREFLRLDPPSARDVDELFEYLRGGLAAPALRRAVRARLPALAALRPAACADLLAQHLLDAAAEALRDSDEATALALGDRLLAAGALGGDAALEHWRRVCGARAGRAAELLPALAGLLRPEDALRVARERGAREAEPACLEAAGDAGAALDALLALLAAAEGERAERLRDEAAALCARASSATPAAEAARLWRRAAAARLGAGRLLGALQHVPAAELLAGADAGAARRLLAEAAGAAAAWRVATRLCQREAALRSRAARREAGRGVAGGARCAACGRGGPALRLAVCAHGSRTTHADCAAPCRGCGPTALRDLTLAPLATRLPQPTMPHELNLVAPPRPNLEGIA